MKIVNKKTFKSSDLKFISNKHVISLFLDFIFLSLYNFIKKNLLFRTLGIVLSHPYRYHCIFFSDPLSIMIFISLYCFFDFEIGYNIYIVKRGKIPILRLGQFW